MVIVARRSGPTEARSELLDERLRQRTKAWIRKAVDSLQSEVKVGLSRRARGFIAIARSAAPSALLASEELRGACPDTATLMRLEVAL